MSLTTIRPTVDVLASGYATVEGPTVHPDGHVYFTNPDGGGVHRLTGDGTVEVVVPKRRGTGGVAAHEAGGIVISGRDLTHVIDGTSTVLVQREDIATPPGLHVGGFNDIHADRWGRVFAGCHLRDAGDVPQPGVLVMVAPDEDPVVVYGGVVFTNGIAQSPDGGWLYHADSEGREIIVSDIGPETVPVRRRSFSTTAVQGHPDGIACDADGLLWVACSGGGGIARFRPDGTLDTWVALPMAAVLSVCFAGEDVDGMFVATMDDGRDETPNGALLRIDVGHHGAPVGLARI